jgi:hypothetical protein
VRKLLSEVTLSAVIKENHRNYPKPASGKMTFMRSEEEPEENPLEFDESFGQLQIGGYAYTVLYERAKKLPKKNPPGFSLPSDENTP